MMEGIQVINETTKFTGFPLIAPIIFIAIGIIMLLMGVSLYFRNNDVAIQLLAGAVVALLFSAYAFYSYYTKKPYIEYKVLINRSVSFIELRERYEIIAQDGNIYTIIKKED